MVARISPVAFCRSSASASSRFSLLFSFLTSTPADARWRAVDVWRFLTGLRAICWRFAISEPHSSK